MIGVAAIHYIKVSLGLEKPATQTSENERAMLVLHCKNAKVAVEIGVFEGVNTALIAEHILDDGKLYAIDPFFKGKFGICYSKLITLGYLKKKKVSKKIILIEKLSFDAVQEVPNNIDFIFIDGDHSWKGIEKDWNDWSFKLKTNGIIAMHDTVLSPVIHAKEKLDSMRFFDEVILFDDRYEVIDKVDSLHILKRKA